MEGKTPSFFAVEAKQRRVVRALFALLVLFYTIAIDLVLNFLLHFLTRRRDIFFPETLDTFPPTLPEPFPFLSQPFIFFSALAVAFFIAYFHWRRATKEMVERILRLLDAQPLDSEDAYHNVARHLLEEMSLAAGGLRVEGWVVPVSAKNAFALSDGRRRFVVGFTEGAVSRLNRDELQAVAAHEIAHCANGHAFLETVTTSLFEIYGFMLSSLTEEMQVEGSDISMGRVPLPPTIPLYIALWILRGLSLMTYLCLSRQRELETDAAAVRLTRNPTALAKALLLMAPRPEIAGEKKLASLATIFMLAPRRRKLEEKTHLLATLFSTHPPFQVRLNLLLALAHRSRKALEQELRNRTPPVYFQGGGLNVKRYYASDSQGNWKGPYTLSGLVSLPFFTPDTYVYREGKRSQMERASAIRAIREKLKEKGFRCPECRVLLVQRMYEGIEVPSCKQCDGFFLTPSNLTRLLLRSPGAFPQDVIEEAEEIADNAEQFRYRENLGKRRHRCPSCKEKMRRHYFNYVWSVEVESCRSCKGKWLAARNMLLLEALFEQRLRKQETQFFES